MGVRPRALEEYIKGLERAWSLWQEDFREEGHEGHLDSGRASDVVSVRLNFVGMKLSVAHFRRPVSWPYRCEEVRVDFLNKRDSENDQMVAMIDLIISVGKS
jgi:hypothetical protein